jgi:hypothetical protein
LRLFIIRRLAKKGCTGTIADLLPPCDPFAIQIEEAAILDDHQRHTSVLHGPGSGVKSLNMDDPANKAKGIPSSFAWLSGKTLSR